MYKAIIWDFGGTLFDTLTGVGTSIQKALNAYGIEENLDNIVSKMKVSVSDLTSYYMDKFNLNEDFIHKVNQLDSEIDVKFVSPIYGSKGICIEAKKRGILNFIVSHRDTSLITFLSAYEMEDIFDEIVTSEMSLKRKPNPDSYLYLIEKYNLDISQVIAIGDRDCDIEAANRASIHSCRINNNLCENKFAADFEINELMELVDILGLSKDVVEEYEY